MTRGALGCGALFALCVGNVWLLLLCAFFLTLVNAWEVFVLTGMFDTLHVSSTDEYQWVVTVSALLMVCVISVLRRFLKSL